MRVELDAPQVTRRQLVHFLAVIFSVLTLLSLFFLKAHQAHSANLKGFCVIGLVGTGLITWGMVLCLLLWALGCAQSSLPCVEPAPAKA